MSKTPTTKLCRYTNDQVFVHNVDLCKDLIGKISFTEMIFFHLMDRRPRVAETAMLDAILVTLMEHGLTPSAITTRMIALSSPEAPQAAVAAGLLAVGSQFIGTIEDSARLLQALVAGKGSLEEQARETVMRYRQEKRLLPGFGHHLHRPDDPRTPVILAVAREHGLAGRHVDALMILGKTVDEAAGRHITINVTGAIGAILSDMEIPVDIIRGIAVISRAAGLVGHIKEERESPAARFIWELAEEHVHHAGDVADTGA
ncbi:citrate synthase [Rhodoligotrophos appendicifer]|uniref:citryl-CoA lyase n=1 Tax=Rhodoligotrophos appendicifer TaxID=987056 RepID=UPI0011859A18|nr:citryl-CoA lyase [Rhodoligotrophos appendicifer]